MNINTKERIGWWILKGKQVKNPFFRFFIFYTCFDTWITTESGEEAFEKKLKWFLGNDNCLKNEWSGILDTTVKSWLAGLKKLSPVEDMRPNHRGKKVYLDNIDNLGEVIKFIYQIRCNLFHGSKNPMDNNDANLVELSGRILERWICWAHLKCW